MQTKRQRAREMRQAMRYSVETLPEEQQVNIPSMFPGWTPGAVYTTGDKLHYAGKLYSVIQSHTAQDNWTPEAMPALYRALGVTPEVPDAVPDWKQPIGAHDAYGKGNKVMYQGKTWESTVDANIYAPGVVAGQWVQE